MQPQPTPFSLCIAVADVAGVIFSGRVALAGRCLLGSVYREDLPLTWRQAGDALAAALAPSFDALGYVVEPPAPMGPIARAAAELSLRSLFVGDGENPMIAIPTEAAGVHPDLGWAAGSLGEMLGRVLEVSSQPERMEAAGVLEFGVNVLSDGLGLQVAAVVARLANGSAIAEFGPEMARNACADEQRMLRGPAIAHIAHHCLDVARASELSGLETHVRAATAEAAKATIQ